MRRRTVRIAAFGLAASLALTALTGCTKHATKSRKSESGAADITLTKEGYGLVLSSDASAYDDLVAQGFSDTMKEAGRKAKIRRPKGGTVAEQQKYVKELTEEKVSSIAISPNDADALKEALDEAMGNGIDVCTFGQSGTPESRELMISPVGSDAIAKTLMESVLDISGGSGEWAILSGSSVSALDNLWIDKMKKEMKDDAYSSLELLEIAYGNDQFQTSYDQTKALLQNYPDLKVICAPTTAGMKAAAEAIRDAKSGVRLTGLGLPSEMADYVGEDGICPYFFLWNPVDLGSLTAYVSIALHGDQITGELGEQFKAGGLGTFTVTKADDDGTEVVLGAPYRFDSNNITQWSKKL